MSKTTVIVIAAVAVVGGVVLYRRGKTQLSAGTSRPGLIGTLVAGAKGAVAEVRAQTPRAPTGGPGITTTPTKAGGDPRTTQTAPTHSRFRLSKLAAARPPLTAADRFAFGIN